jgi:hypothetical protein
MATAADGDCSGTAAGPLRTELAIEGVNGQQDGQIEMEAMNWWVGGLVLCASI